MFLPLTAIANLLDVADTTSDGTESLYDLIANVSHELLLSSTGNESHVFRSQILDRASDLWFELEGLLVEEVKKDVISTGESVLQIWQRRRST